jgi:hypothetical protein
MPQKKNRGYVNVQPHLNAKGREVNAKFRKGYCKEKDGSMSFRLNKISLIISLLREFFELSIYLIVGEMAAIMNKHFVPESNGLTGRQLIIQRFFASAHSSLA